ncbi:MAG TPA: hypothetical protein PKH77_12425 [Anaerolineae bacterium]|nr:hypothetical protein [Anaerolineae bacterium]
MMTDIQNDTDSLLKQGVAAARAGDREAARKWLAQALRGAPDNISAWLWLSAVVEKPEERESCLRKALALDPDNAAARRGLAEVQAQETAALLRAGQEAAAAGESARAQELLLQVVARDEGNLTAWEILSRIMADPVDREVALENLLTLDPENIEARRKLAILRQTREAAEENVWGTVAEDEARPRESPTLASAVLGDEFVARYTTVIPEPEPEPEHPALALWARYDDETLCPYCATHTEFDDRRCAACGNPLWLKLRRREQPSLWFWVLLALQAFSTAFTLALPLAILALLSFTLGATFSQVFSVYLGNDTALPPEVLQAALAMLPRLVFFLSWMPFVISLTMLVVLYLRWPPVYYLMLVSSILGLLGSLLGLLFNLSQGGLAIASGVIGAFVSLVELLIVLQLEDDFTYDRKRILFQVDTSIKNGVGFLLQGRRYAARHLWALAALHFRRAAAMLPYQIDGHVALALACIHLKEYELARYALEEVRRINPQAQQLAELLALLDQKVAEAN